MKRAKARCEGSKALDQMNYSRGLGEGGAVEVEVRGLL